MIHYLAAVHTTAITGFFGTIGHYIGEFFRLGLPVVWIGGVILHFLITRRLGIPINHWLAAFVLGALAMVAFPSAAAKVGSLSSGPRDWLNGIIVLFVLSDVFMVILRRIRGGGGE